MAEINTKTLYKWQTSGQNFVLIDTLPPTAFAKGHIPGAIHIMSDDILDCAPTMLPDRNACIVVYCASVKCKRAGLAAQRLETLGYTDVHHYRGGKRAWCAAGHELTPDALSS